MRADEGSKFFVTFYNFKNICPPELFHKQMICYPLDTGHIQKTSKTSSECLIYVQFTSCAQEEKPNSGLHNMYRVHAKTVKKLE